MKNIIFTLFLQRKNDYKELEEFCEKYKNLNLVPGLTH